MKKRIFLFFIISFFCFVPFNSYALSNEDTYVVNDTTYNVNMENEQTILDYFYYTYYKNFENNQDYYFTMIYSNSKYNFVIFKNDSTISTFGSNILKIKNTNPYIFSLDDNNNLTSKTQLAIPRGYQSESMRVIYSSIDLIVDNTNYFESNITTEQIESRYIIEEPIEEPTGEPTNENIIFPINKEEFYALLVLLSVFFLTNYFKWCFPMKGGKKL